MLVYVSDFWERMKGVRFIFHVQIMFILLGLLSFINTKLSPAGLSQFIRWGSHNSIENDQTSAECITLHDVNNNTMDDRLTSLHESLVKFIMKHKQQIQSTIKESLAVSGAQQYHLLLEKIANLMQTGTLRFDPNDLLLKSDERENTFRVVKRALGILKDEAAATVKLLMSWLATDPDLNITWYYGGAKEVLMCIECMDWTDKHKF
jgi:hypothetical protein